MIVCLLGDSLRAYHATRVEATRCTSGGSKMSTIALSIVTQSLLGTSFLCLLCLILLLVTHLETRREFLLIGYGPTTLPLPLVTSRSL